jgi:sulfate adenylyltransferase subunit 1 (EFTu-like GTPase family)
VSELDTLVPIVIVGAVDHGKSTFIGRLLVDTQQLTPDRLEDLHAASRDLDRKVEYAHVTDQFQEEREANITIDTTQTRFDWDGRTYVLIDAPGHREYLANMITGAARARHALLLLDVNEGVREQTEKHARILRLLQISHVGVLINKMDLVGYKQDVFERSRDLITEVLTAQGLKPDAVIPIAAYAGENVAKKSEMMPWYRGLHAREFIASCRGEGKATDKRGVRFPVQLIHDVEGARLLLGRVEEGVIKAGQALKAFPQGETVKVGRLRVHGQPDLSEAGVGVCLGLEIEGRGDFSRGTIFCDEKSFARPLQSAWCDVFWASNDALKTGQEYLIECRTQSVPGQILEIKDEEAGTTLGSLSQGGIGRVKIKFNGPILLIDQSESDVFGRVVFNRSGETVGCGVVAELE